HTRFSRDWSSDVCSSDLPSVDTANPDVRVHAFLTRDALTLYLDTSGEPLYKRGFKRAAVEAPLKENLAAGILRLTGWTPDEALRSEERRVGKECSTRGEA